MEPVPPLVGLPEPMKCYRLKNPIACFADFFGVVGVSGTIQEITRIQFDSTRGKEFHDIDFSEIKPRSQKLTEIRTYNDLETKNKLILKLVKQHVEDGKTVVLMDQKLSNKTLEAL